MQGQLSSPGFSDLILQRVALKLFGENESCPVSNINKMIQIFRNAKIFLQNTQVLKLFFYQYFKGGQIAATHR
jgi:hypothetical protein